MNAAHPQSLDLPAASVPLRDRLVRARFEVLAEWGMSPANARAIEVVSLLRRGCPAPMVLAILS